MKPEVNYWRDGRPGHTDALASNRSLVQLKNRPHLSEQSILTDKGSLSFLSLCACVHSVGSHSYTGMHTTHCKNASHLMSNIYIFGEEKAMNSRAEQ